MRNKDEIASRNLAMTFNPLRYEPREIYGAELFDICNPNNPLEADYDKIHLMDAVLTTMEGFKGFEATKLMADTAPSKALSNLMNDIYDFSSAKALAIKGRQVVTPYIKVIMTPDGIGMAAIYPIEKNLWSLPVWYLPWLMDYDRELATLWLGAVGSLGCLGVSHLGMLCEGKSWYDEMLLKIYTPEAEAERVGAVVRSYEPLFRQAKKRYGKNGMVWKIAEKMLDVVPSDWQMQFMEYLTTHTIKPGDMLRYTLVGMMTRISALLMSGQDLRYYTHLSDQDKERGVLPMNFTYQVLWHQDDYRTCEENQQPDLMTRIHTTFILNAAEQQGVEGGCLQVRLYPGEPAQEPAMLLPNLLNEIFMLAYKFAHKYFDYDPHTGMAIYKAHQKVSPSKPIRK